MPTRGTSNANSRGSSDARRRRRAYLVKTYASDVPGFCRCFRCGRLLGEREVTVDRIIPGCDGGTYARGNIRPACARCNQRTGSALGNLRQTGKAPALSVWALDFGQLARAIAAARLSGGVGL